MDMCRKIKVGADRLRAASTTSWPTPAWILRQAYKGLPRQAGPILCTAMRLSGATLI